MAHLSTSIDEAIKKIDSKLECSVCHKTFTEPTLLPCFHTFCKSPCLEQLASQGPKGQTLICPSCQHLVSLPNSGVSGLQTDHQAQHLSEQKRALEKAKNPVCENCEKSVPTCYCQQCRVFMCQECAEMHSKWKDFSLHTIRNKEEIGADITNKFTVNRTPSQCTEHREKALDMYCKTCSELICSDCSKGTHKNHKYNLVEDILSSNREELVSGLTPLKEMLDKVEQTLTTYDTKTDEIKTHGATVETNIQTEFNRLHQLLDQDKTDLIARLNVVIQQKLKALGTRRDLVERMQGKMSRCLEYAEAGLETGAENEVVRLKDLILKRVQEITAEFDPDSIQPDMNTDIEMSPEERGKVCRVYEKLTKGKTDSQTPTVTNYYLIGDSSVLKPGEKSTIEVLSMSRNNGSNEHSESLTAELVHNRSKVVTKCTVNQKNGRHMITYQPSSRGRHSLHIMVNGEHIQGSPHPIPVAPVSDSVYSPFRTVPGLTRPSCVAVNSKGHMVVIERATYCVSVLTPEGEKILSFSSNGSEPGQLNSPGGVAIDLNDCIYVTDTNNHRIQKYTSEGKFTKGVGGGGGSKIGRRLKFSSPTGICFNKTNFLLYVCDQQNHRIVVLTADLTVVRCFGEKGSKPGQLHTPTHATFDSVSNLHVTDCGNNCVHVFTADGQFIKAFSDKGDGTKLEKPYAIAIDSSDTVYVSEGERQCVSVFTAQGEYVASFGEQGVDAGQFNGVPGLCVDQDDSVIVADFSNNRLQMF